MGRCIGSSNIGAVVTHLARGISQEGFDAEWRDVHVLAVEGDMVSRSELFDETDLDAAIARFDELSRPAPRLENTASQIADRVMAHFTAREWDAATAMLADDFSSDDRRRTVNAGLRRGRDAAIKDANANADLGAKEITSTVIATRGERLVLRRARYSDSTQGPEAFYVDALSIYEINGVGRVAANVTFDIDDIDAAFEELDARYLAGEAAPHARTWSVITGSYAAFNRHEVPAADWVTVDHRQITPFEPDNMTPSVRTIWDFTPDLSIHIEAVHRLNNFGAVISHEGHGTSQEGFHAEWRAVDLLTVDGDLIIRCEVFDEADVDDAVARFDQLSRPAPRLENTASQAVERYSAYFAARDWDALAKLLANDISIDDRRRVVNAGIRHGRDAEIANLRATADAGFVYVTSVVIAARGERLILTRTAGRDRGSEEFLSDALGVVEINSHNRIAAIVIFDLDDFDAAIAELDARYLAGEAAPYSQTWSVISGSYAAINRHQQPATTPDCVNIDHRRETAMGVSDLIAYIDAGPEKDQDYKAYVETVHRLTGPGAVVTYAAHETSQEGFDAEWRGVAVFTVEGELVNRTEVFNEANLDAAITRFDQLSRPAPRLDNAASRANARFLACVGARDWDAIASILADDHYSDDRRRVTGAGTRRGRDADIENIQVLTDLGATITAEVIATRGDRLILTRTRASFDQQQQGFLAEVLTLVETDLDGRIAVTIALDLEDIEAALEELDARYLAGEAAAHARVWSVIVGGFVTMRRYELPPTTPDCVSIDHRRAAAFAPVS